MRSVVVQIGFGPRERQAVIAGHRDQGVLDLSRLFEGLDHPPQMQVEPIDLSGVIEQIRTYGFSVRQRPRQPHIGYLFPALQPRARLVRPVWLETAIPETERLAGAALPEKIDEIGVVIVIVNPCRGRFQGTRIELRPRRIAFASTELVVPRPPTLACEADGIPRALQQVRVDLELRRQRAP